MSAITIPNTLPTTIVALSLEAIEARDQLLDRAVAVRAAGVDSIEAWEAADRLYKELASFAKGIKTQRLELKRPILALGEKLDEAAHDAVEPIEKERAMLGDLVEAFKVAENARREAERKKAEEEARAREAQLRADAEAKAQQDRERAELEALPGEEPAEPEFGQQPIVRPVAAAWTPAPLKGSTKTTVKKRAVITDEALLPLAVNGIHLWKEPDMVAIATLLKAGVAVPGAVYVDEVTVGAKGR